MASIFSRIVLGEIPCYKIAETADYLAFLDASPQVKGHTLCIPKRETDYIFDLEDDDLAGLMVFAKKVANAVKSVVPCRRIGVAVIGLEVPHAHIHLMPLQKLSDFSFGKGGMLTSPEEMKALAEEIAAQVSL